MSFLQMKTGEGCLIALRDISAGEWLAVLPSDSEEEGGEEEEGEEEEDST